ncbi:hypothetical protein [Roseivirga sp. UBA1976]|uniref:hypothetical protein n=1 Tax=Roseivirga sp. UBA1976 TaxID=1947386 RepID=UPI00257DD2AE|nr:hypothetical protein [Roseivirga sp. UBA1976]
MRNVRKMLSAAMVMSLGVAAWAQDVQVKTSKNWEVKVDPQVLAEVEAIAERAVHSVVSDFEFDMDFDHNGKKIEYQQNTQEIEIPLSKPGERGKLDIDNRNGKVKVTGYDGPTVKVKMIKYEKKVERGESKNGMRLVSSGGFNVEASENNNTVRLESEGWNNRVDFEVMVPKNFNIKAETYNNGHIVIEGVNGEVNVESYNGSITLTNISGSASASTYNGAIEVTFAKVTPETPMAFSTYNGNVDISVPTGTNFTAKMRTNRDIFTDFESFSIKQAQPVSNKNNKGGFSMKYESWVEGDLNGGGAEVMMKTTNGNIYIRKK